MHAAKRGIRVGGCRVFSIDESVKHCIHLVLLLLLPPHTTVVHGRVRVLSDCMFAKYLFLIFKRAIRRRRHEWENASIIIIKCIVWCACVCARFCVCVRRVCERDKTLHACLYVCVPWSK